MCIQDKLKLADDEDQTILGDDIADDDNRLYGVTYLIGKVLQSALIVIMQKIENVFEGFKAKQIQDIILLSSRSDQKSCYLPPIRKGYDIISCYCFCIYF